MAPSRPPRPPARPARDPKELLKKRGTDLIRKVSDKDRFAIFLEPVDLDAVAGYADVIHRPMDLSTAQKNLHMGVYRTPMELRADLDLIWSNCCTFNADDSIYYKEAVRLRALAARHYDDMVRALSRDGVAAALGLTNSRQNGPASSRPVGKRPPRHRAAGPQSGGAQSSSLITSEPTSPEADADASASPSASGSASAAVLSSFRDTQIRRAEAAAQAAAAAAAQAEEHARAAAIAAGITPSTVLSAKDGLAGPPPISRGSNDADGLRSSHLHTLNHLKARNRCSEVPLAWRRIGRWHTRGATMSKFNSRERALDVHYGRLYQKHVHRSAPLARRILATILAPEVVRQHDQTVIAQQSRQLCPNGTHNGIEKNGRLTCLSVEKTGKQRNVTASDRDGILNGNGLSDAMDIDPSPRNNWASEKTRGSAPGQPRDVQPLVGREGALGTGETKGSEGEQFVRKVVQEGTTEDARQSGQKLQKQQRMPSRRALARLQLLLKEHSVDPSFLGGLVSSVNGSGKTSAHPANMHDKAAEEAVGNNLDHMLSTNHSTLMNVMRLRALREGADEAECEDLEDRERECVEGLAKGMTLTLEKVPPRLMIHPVDVAEGTVALCQSIQPQQPRE